MAGNCSGCCEAPKKAAVSPRYRRALWIALAVNVAMFGVELVAGWRAGSVSLLADAVDFFGDAANYGLSLAVLAMLPLWRARAALVKGLTMGGYGLFVLGQALHVALAGGVPQAYTMGVVGFVALIANTAVAAMLYAFRQGDADMRSVWLCSRNDAIGNVAVMLAALGVLGTGSAWPDLIVAAVMAALALSASASVITQALRERSPARFEAPAHRRRSARSDRARMSQSAAGNTGIDRSSAPSMPPIAEEQRQQAGSDQCHETEGPIGPFMAGGR